MLWQYLTKQRLKTVQLQAQETESRSLNVYMSIMAVQLFASSLPASGYFYHLLITFAKSLDPDQAWQNVWPFRSKLFDTLMAFLKAAFEKVVVEKNQMTKKSWKITQHTQSYATWACTWQNQQSDLAPSEDSDQSVHQKINVLFLETSQCF